MGGEFISTKLYHGLDIIEDKVENGKVLISNAIYDGKKFIKNKVVSGQEIIANLKQRHEERKVKEKRQTFLKEPNIQEEQMFRLPK